eukprot:2367377-Amphidinium_carterae.1
MHQRAIHGQKRGCNLADGLSKMKRSSSSRTSPVLLSPASAGDQARQRSEKNKPRSQHIDMIVATRVCSNSEAAELTTN